MDYITPTKPPEPKRERVVIVYPQIFANQDQDANRIESGTIGGGW